MQHPDGVWTWKQDRTSRSSALWLPYLQSVEKLKDKGRWRLAYNGGGFDADLAEVDTVMLYGASGSLPVEFLDDLNTHRTPLLVHRRNIDSPYLFLPFRSRDSRDMLSAQIRVRDNEIRRCYIARTLVRNRFQNALPQIPIPETAWRSLATLRSIKAIRIWEAHQARRFWSAYFSNLNLPEQTRREGGPLPSALDACSFFLFGVMLRWVLLHRMSPTHGFLHEPTEYPSLVYDLIEPYRNLMERAVCASAQQGMAKGVDLRDTSCSRALTESALALLKTMLDETVHAQPTRQWVRRKNLLHGAVLALRAYLIGDMPRLVIPQELPPAGGRPVKVSYRLPGQRRIQRGVKVAPSVVQKKSPLP